MKRKGQKNCNEKGPKEDPCFKVEDSDGLEDKIMENMDDYLKKNRIWILKINDCHTAAEYAIKKAGLKYPGAPCGRFNIDDVLRNFFDSILSKHKSCP